MEISRHLIAAKESVEHDILKRSGVTGVAVGYKYVGGKRTDQVAIQVFVQKKKKEVTKAEAVPKQIEGYPTDVIERVFKPHPVSAKVLDLTPMADTGTYNPVKGGISIGPCRSVGGYVFAGTLGVVVRDNSTGDPLLLSNFHVMCVDSGWSVGDQMVQPSRVDTGVCPGGVLGTLLRAQLTSSVDGAVCTLSGRGWACEIVDIGAVAGTSTATLNLDVRKRGRTTGLTYGKVDSLSLSVNIDYGDGIGSKTLTNQIGITSDTSKNPKFGDHGDSGSVVVDGNRKVIGLYFAGSDDGYGVANPIAAVLSALNISICSPPKSIIKDITKEGKREGKEFKVEKVEVKEKREIKEIVKERKEIKEFKVEKVEKAEFEHKNPAEVGPKISEVGPLQPPIGDPGLPGVGPATPGSLEQRVAQLEAAIGQLATFISSEMRPDLGAGALSREADCGQTQQQLQKQAEDALQAKVDYDNNPR